MSKFDRLLICAALVSSAAFGCAKLGHDRLGPPRAFDEAPPSEAERYCAWYGDARDGVLYFGQAAFWSTFRSSGGNSNADLEIEGPQPIGRFDLESLKLLPPLDVTAPGARSGVWDVLAHENGWVYYTTYFESMGRVEVATGAVERFDQLGEGLNEIAPGPDGALLVSRYADEEGGSGSVLVVSPEGERLTELALPAAGDEKVLPKTVAWDPVRREIWVTTDGIFDDDRPARHDAYVLGLDGKLRRRVSTPEVHFVAFDESGVGYRAEVEGTRLRLAIPPADGPDSFVVLDESFAPDLDFVQDIQIGPHGRAWVMRWSGFVHVVDAASGGEVRTLRLPPVEPDGLYYTAVPSADGADALLCATYCAGVTVMCR